MVILDGKDIIIITKDDARKLVNYFKRPRMTKAQLEKYGKAGILDIILDMADILRKEEPIE